MVTDIRIISDIRIIADTNIFKTYVFYAYSEVLPGIFTMQKG